MSPDSKETSVSTNNNKNEKQNNIRRGFDCDEMKWT